MELLPLPPVVVAAVTPAVEVTSWSLAAAAALPAVEVMRWSPAAVAATVAVMSWGDAPKTLEGGRKRHTKAKKVAKALLKLSKKLAAGRRSRKH